MSTAHEEKSLYTGLFAFCSVGHSVLTWNFETDIKNDEFLCVWCQFSLKFSFHFPSYLILHIHNFCYTARGNSNQSKKLADESINGKGLPEF